MRLPSGCCFPPTSSVVLFLGHLKGSHKSGNKESLPGSRSKCILKKKEIGILKVVKRVAWAWEVNHQVKVYGAVDG